MGAVYSQLSIEERRRIERWRHAKVPVREMARVLKRSDDARLYARHTAIRQFRPDTCGMLELTDLY